jgi:hypothetical protein
MEDFMQNTSISFKTFLVTAALVAPFIIKADAQRDLKHINKEIDATLQNMETDFSNQEDNNGPTRLKADYKRRFAGQLKQLRNLLEQANKGTNGGRGRGGASAKDLEIAPILTNTIANLDRLGQLDALDDSTRDDVREFLEGINPGKDQRLANQIDAAIGILSR